MFQQSFLFGLSSCVLNQLVVRIIVRFLVFRQDLTELAQRWCRSLILVSAEKSKHVDGWASLSKLPKVEVSAHLLSFVKSLRH